MAYYILLFDQATDVLWEAIGLGEAYRTGRHTTFAAEAHTLYRAELLVSDAATIHSQIIALDAKRLHVAHEMRRLRDRTVAAQQELLYLSVSLDTRRVTPWPEATFRHLETAAASHAVLERPAWLGRVIVMSTPPLPSPKPSTPPALG